MSDNPSTQIPALAQTSIEQQIMALRLLAEQTRDVLQKWGASLPLQVVENLNLLNRNLDQLSRQAALLQEEEANLVALSEVSQVINSSLELDEVLRIVMDTIVRLIGAERGFLMLRDERGEMVNRIARNWEQASIADSEFAVSRTVINRVVNEGQPVLTTNAQEDPRFGHQESIIFYNLCSILCVPLIRKGEITGVIYADNRIRKGIFSEADRNLLAAFANQAAVAIENARLFESVRRTLAEVTELKNLMDNVFASIASGVITTDLSEQVTLCNRAARTILAEPASEWVGQTIDKMIPSLHDTISPYFTAIQSNDQPVVGIEVTPVLPNRGRVILSLNLSPLKDAAQSTQGVTIVMDDLTEKKRLEAQRRLFERMVSPAVIDQLDPDQLQLGGKRAAITTLFADIRGFTAFSEPLPPEELVAILNRYLAAAADAVLAQEGTIDKFIGDAIMAWFNAPIPQPDHTLRAVRAALGLRAAVHRLQSGLPPQFHLDFGAGIHFGDAVLGLVGTEKRMEYTAIGDSINTAKRIQENAVAGQILISAEAYAWVKDQVRVRAVEPLHVKGKRQPVQVLEIIGLR